MVAEVRELLHLPEGEDGDAIVGSLVRSGGTGDDQFPPGSISVATFTHEAAANLQLDFWANTQDGAVLIADSDPFVRTYGPVDTDKVERFPEPLTLPLQPDCWLIKNLVSAGVKLVRWEVKPEHDSPREIAHLLDSFDWIRQTEAVAVICRLTDRHTPPEIFKRVLLDKFFVLSFRNRKDDQENGPPANALTFYSHEMDMTKFMGLVAASPELPLGPDRPSAPAPEVCWFDTDTGVLMSFNEHIPTIDLAGKEFLVTGQTSRKLLGIDGLIPKDAFKREDIVN